MKNLEILENMNLTSRILSTSDALNIAEVYKAHEGDSFEALLSSSGLDYSNYVESISVAIAKMSLSESVVIGIFMNDTLIGCCNVQLMYDTYIGYTNRPYAHLETGIFKPTFEGLGYNNILLDAVKSYLISKNCIFVMVNTRNKYAMRSLEKNGFIKESTRYVYNF